MPTNTTSSSRIPDRRPGRSPRNDSRRPGEGSRLTREFHSAFNALSKARSDYEDTRRAGGDLELRARLLSELHELRSHTATVIRGGAVR